MGDRPKSIEGDGVISASFFLLLLFFCPGYLYALQAETGRLTSAATPAPLFLEVKGPQPAMEAISTQRFPVIKRERRVYVQTVLLETDKTRETAPVLLFNLFADTQYTALFYHRSPNPLGGTIWQGRLVGNNGKVVLVIDGNRISSILEADGRRFQISPRGQETHTVQEVDPTLFQALIVKAVNDCGATGMESEVIAYTNSYRAGLTPLTCDPTLVGNARSHSEYMAVNNVFTHSSNPCAGYSYYACGENIAAGYSSAAAVVTAWMNSPSHQANILYPSYCNIGAGYVLDVTDTLGYYHYWTQNFGRPTDLSLCSGGTGDPTTTIESTSTTTSSTTTSTEDPNATTSTSSTSTSSSTTSTSTTHSLRTTSTSSSTSTSTSTSTTTSTIGYQLLLNKNRFRVTVWWRNYNTNATGLGAGIPLTGDSGSFWFFSRGNIELVIKVLDGRSINGNFWVLYGALSDVEYRITITDTQTGQIAEYYNPPRTLSSHADVNAFPPPDSSLSFRPSTDTFGMYGRLATMLQEQQIRLHAIDLPEDVPSDTFRSGSSAGGCTADDTTLCLNNNRFRVQVLWKNYNNGSTGTGKGVLLPGGANESGYFWFFHKDNVELMIKILDGRAINGHFWIMYGALSDVEYTISVIDTVSGAACSYHNPPHNIAGDKDLGTF